MMKQIKSMKYLFVLALLFVLISSNPIFAQRQNFLTPEATLEIYINALRAADKKTVLKCFFPELTDFYLPSKIDIKAYMIVKKKVFTKKEVQERNSRGIIPSAKIGDVNLDVAEIVDGEHQMYSYLFRKVSMEWKIISYSAWGID